jgi:D-alanyl-D-alanine carboxypeptidase
VKAPEEHAASRFDRAGTEQSKDLITFVIEIPSQARSTHLYSASMESLRRATRGGVGAAIIGAGLAAFSIVAGLAAGALYDGLAETKGCVGACGAAPAQAEAISTEIPGPTPTPTPSDPAGFPYVSARSIAILDSGCGALIYGRGEHERMPPASLTKLMTAAVAMDYGDLDDMYTSDISGAQMLDDTGSTIMGIEPGMTLSLRDLLYGLLLPSGNDAAIVIAKGIGGSEERFVLLMNDKARGLALDDTNFTNAHGLYEAGLYSTAYDMAILARYVMQNPELRTIVSTIEYQPAWDGPAVWNGNRFLTEYEGADGVKIGFTEESQQTIVASAVRDGRRIIVSAMRSQDRYQDATRLFDWAFAQPSPCP